MFAFIDSRKYKFLEIFILNDSKEVNIMTNEIVKFLLMDFMYLFSTKTVLSFMFSIKNIYVEESSCALEFMNESSLFTKQVILLLLFYDRTKIF